MLSPVAIDSAGLTTSYLRDILYVSDSLSLGILHWRIVKMLQILRHRRSRIQRPPKVEVWWGWDLWRAYAKYETGNSKEASTVHVINYEELLSPLWVNERNYILLLRRPKGATLACLCLRNCITATVTSADTFQDFLFGCSRVSACCPPHLMMSPHLSRGTRYTFPVSHATRDCCVAAAADLARNSRSLRAV